MNDKRYSLWEDYYDFPVGNNLFNETLKFHNKTNWIHKDNMTNMYDSIVKDWASSNAYKSKIPQNNFGVFELEKTAEKGSRYGTERNFSDKRLNSVELSNLLIRSFGTNTNSSKRSYPSAGALYPVIPILYLFEQESILGMKCPAGIFVFDSNKNTLVMLKEMDDLLKDKLTTIMNNNGDEKLPSNYCIGYALDFSKTITKYKFRGYRHGIMEVGSMLQAFRVACWNSSGIAEFCSSAYDDFQVSKLSGLNLRDSQIILIQWFGKVENIVSS